MSDILSNRTGALDRLLAELDNPPPVPPKDDRRRFDLPYREKHDPPPQITLSNDAWQDPVAQVAQAADSSAEDLEIISESEDSAVAWENTRRTSFGGTTVTSDYDLEGSFKPTSLQAKTNTTKPESLITKRKKVVTFAQDDSAEEYSEDEMETPELFRDPSLLDPEPAPRFGRSRDGAKKKPAPLNLNRPTSHTGKWNVHRESDIWTPIDDEPNTAAMIAMDIAPKICPLPYKPVKSVPLKSRGSLRPAPLRVRKGVRFDTMKSPAYLPLKSPAPFKKSVRFDVLKSPAVARFRTPATPYSNTQFQVLTPRRKRGVRFDSIKSPAASKFKMPPTPYHKDSFEDSASAPKRGVRFDAVKSPARSRFKTPTTPYYKASFGASASTSRRGVRFANLKSPAVSNFKTPPTPYNKSSFKVSSSPPDFSPVTPRAMHMMIPAIAPDSPTVTSPAFRPISAAMDDSMIPDSSMQRYEHSSNSKQMEFPPRTSSLHRRNASLPKDVRVHEEIEANILPATQFDEGAVGASTLRWLGMLPKPSYRVNQENLTDRNKILGSYFHKSTPSF